LKIYIFNKKIIEQFVFIEFFKRKKFDPSIAIKVKVLNARSLKVLIIDLFYSPD